MDFSRIISLNESAAQLWEAIGDSEFSADNMAGLLVSWYDVSETAALADSEKLIEMWSEAGLIEQ